MRGKFFLKIFSQCSNAECETYNISLLLPKTTEDSFTATISVLKATFPGEPGSGSFIEAKDDGSGGDDWSYRTCKAPVKSSPTNQHQVFFYRLDALLSPNQQCHSTQGKISHSKDLLTPSSPTLSLTTTGSYLSCGRVAMPLISRLTILQRYS